MLPDVLHLSPERIAPLSVGLAALSAAAIGLPTIGPTPSLIAVAAAGCTVAWFAATATRLSLRPPEASAPPAPAAPPAAAAVAEPVPPPPPPPPEGLIRHFGVYDTLFERAHRDTASVTAETEAAAFRILESLRTVDGAMTDLLAFLEASGSNSRVIEIVDETDRQLVANRRLIADFLARRDRDVADCRTRLGEIEAATDHLTTAVEGIRGLAHRTNLLALNAAIEASRAGQFGAGFRIVASEVKHLSQESDQAAARINQGLATLRDSIRSNLVALVTQRIEGERAELSQISTAIAQLTENMERLVSHQRDTLVKVQNESTRISEPIIALIASIQFQDVTRQRLEHLETIFSAARENLGSLTRAANANEPWPEPEPLAAAAMSDGPAPPRDPSSSANDIELF
ncbi:methyl-accepting chemotaxis protein [Methylobacterium sp. ID0610]|uniref:methyl-accepting chemotaxis protein n=1 Tax=Methylobacterium carpenticola TaxID=3344827 RepID=UPI0036A69BEE